MNRHPFRIKICGLTSVDDAADAVDAGADAIGLNFYPKSKRFVELAQAAAISQSIGCGVTKAGVFVNSTIDEILAAQQNAGLDLIQLHGDETPDFLSKLQNIPIMKAVRWNGAVTGNLLNEYLSKCNSLGRLPEFLLIDAGSVGEYGGTGTIADWDSISAWRKISPTAIPIVLAGGLTPANVATAIARVRPDAVDTASGVELSPRKKNKVLIREFVDAARQAFIGSKC